MKLLIVILLLSACANAPQTPEEEYLAVEKDLIRKEAILRFIKNCDAQGNVLVVSNQFMSHADRRKEKDPQKMTLADVPRHAHITNYQCGTSREVRRALNEMMGIY
jgi:hypothetical protein